jgi:hypothetical protein
MALADISGCLPRPRRRTTIRLGGVRTAPDLVGRDFNPEVPDRTYAPQLAQRPA